MQRASERESAEMLSPFGSAMTLGLAFSRDRALQLEAALNSFLRCASETAGVSLVVLYRASSARFEAQYAQLSRDYAGRVRLVAETDFRRQVLQILREALDANSPPDRPAALSMGVAGNAGSAGSGTRRTDFLLLLVDDTLFTLPFRFDTALDALSTNPDALGFSLRLGRNTTYCYTLGRSQSLPAFQELPHALLKFPWTRGDGDFGYPLEISSSIYRLQAISALVQRLKFDDPNSLESQMALQGGRFVREAPALLCHERSVAFNNPINRVQNTFENRSGGAPQYSSQALAERFDLGQRINVEALEGFVTSGCHQEVELEFEPTAR
jgi:hypothetical protein